MNTYIKIFNIVYKTNLKKQLLISCVSKSVYKVALIFVYYEIYSYIRKFLNDNLKVYSFFLSFLISTFLLIKTFTLKNENNGMENKHTVITFW